MNGGRAGGYAMPVRELDICPRWRAARRRGVQFTATVMVADWRTVVLRCDPSAESTDNRQNGSNR